MGDEDERETISQDDRPVDIRRTGWEKGYLNHLTLIYNLQTSQQVGIHQILNLFMKKDDGFFRHDGITEDANEYLNIEILS